MLVNVIIFCGLFVLCCIFFELCFIAFVKPYIKQKKENKKKVDILAKDIIRIIKKYKSLFK